MKRLLIQQLVPIFLTFVTFLVLSTFLYGFLLLLNSIFVQHQVILDFRKRDVLIGIAVYLKTAVDFAIFIGNLMKTNPGWQKRIAIELGTAVGNAFGTFFILAIWVVFKQLPILMAIMVFVASIVLFRMAQESFEEFLKQKDSFIKMRRPAYLLQSQLNFVNKIFRPVLRFFVPNLSLKAKKLSFLNLVVFSFTIPFILGLDDFAGYISLFSIINVFGFALGVLVGHMILNIGLFAIPKKTVQIVTHPIVLIGGGFAFIALGGWGLIEVIRILFTSVL